MRDEENRAIVLLEWESREAFEGFLADAAVRESMQAGGAVGRPEFTFLDIVAEFPSWGQGRLVASGVPGS